MSRVYSVATCRALEQAFVEAKVARPMRLTRYEPHTELSYEVTGVAPAARAEVRLAVERFVGGGFAGQVYRVKVLAIDGEPVAGLTVGGHYALKILLPASSRAKAFRDAVYKLGFQGAFSPQVNPAAARAGALWQKLIRRAAGIHFGTERAVVDVIATLIDPGLGSCGEISEWVDGRTWRFEVDDRLDLRKRWRRGRPVDEAALGSPEYRAKRAFMAEMVRLLHALGAAELARQYEWWTCKSQPNVLKRRDAEGDPAEGLTAVDFRAGLALLPVLPMSPADVKLILAGAARGSLVQFDRGDPGRLQQYVDAHAEHFADLREAVEELKAAEAEYRDSLPDVAHHHVRLLTSGRLWSSVLDAAARGWQLAGVTDEAAGARLRGCRLQTLAFAALGCLPRLSLVAALVLAAISLLWWAISPAEVLLIAALVAAGPPLRLVRRLLGRADYRRHYARALASFGYLRRAVRAHAAEGLIAWHRSGRVSDRRALWLSRRPGWFLAQLPLSLLPARLHRFLTDRRFALAALKYVFARPVLLYFNAAAREQWLRDMVHQGQANGMLTAAEAERIRARTGEPFVQEYLKSLAVHVCTLPVTQIVSVTVAIVYVLSHPELPRAAAWTIGLGIVGAFQITPISPGSIVRGLYVVYRVIAQRNFKDYNIAVFLGFFKYVGYLAFPVQMAYRYPALARFMAGHWATGAAHVVPVFGERGGLLEHGVFDVFYNKLLTLRRRFGDKDLARRHLPVRRWHAGLCALAAGGALALAQVLLRGQGGVPGLWRLWWLSLPVPLLAGAVAAAGARGATVVRRILLGAACGAAAGLLYGASHVALLLPSVAEQAGGGDLKTILHLLGAALWRLLLCTALAAVGAFVTEARPLRAG